MSYRTFIGGIHPPDYKFYSEKSGIEKADLPRKVIIPMSQHIGAPCLPCVEIGEDVLTGQVIGKAGGFVSVPIHSSVSGKVVGLAKYPNSSGKEVMSVFIESDGQDKWLKKPQKEMNYLSLEAEEIKRRILESGKVGLGGATFPTHVKLSPPKGKKIEWLILNGAECEPFLTADHRLMVEKPEEIIEGTRILMHSLGITKAAIGIENNKMDAIRIMTKAAEAHDGIEIITCEVKYPQGAEKNLIKAIIDKEVPSGGLPMDVGVVVQNVGTAFAVYEAVALNKPLIERVVTVTGPGIEKPRNLLVRIGTLFSDIISQCGGFKKGAKVTKVISGGPMMGVAQYSLDVPVMKGTSGILILTDEVKYEVGINPCIRCGKCVAACPMFLLPNELSIIGESRRPDLAEKAHIMDCVECGTCAYVCPSSRPIVQFIRYLKGEVAALKQKEKAK